MASKYVTGPEYLLFSSDVELSTAAYFKQRTVDELTPIEDIPNVGRIPVPDGLFKSARATKSKRDDPRRNALGASAGSESYALSSGSGVLCTIFPSSGNGPQTAHAYTQDGSSRNHSVAPSSPPALADHSTPGRSPVTAFRSSSSALHPPSSHAPPRSVPVPARVAGIRQPPSLVPLEFLQSCSSTRDPTDEWMVQQLSVSRTPSVDPSRSPIGPGGNPGRMVPFSGF